MARMCPKAVDFKTSHLTTALLTINSEEHSTFIVHCKICDLHVIKVCVHVCLCVCLRQGQSRNYEGQGDNLCLFHFYCRVHDCHCSSLE